MELNGVPTSIEVLGVYHHAAMLCKLPVKRADFTHNGESVFQIPFSPDTKFDRIVLVDSSWEAAGHAKDLQTSLYSLGLIGRDCPAEDGSEGMEFYYCTGEEDVEAQFCTFYYGWLPGSKLACDEGGSVVGWVLDQMRERGVQQIFGPDPTDWKIVLFTHCELPERMITFAPTNHDSERGKNSNTAGKDMEKSLDYPMWVIKLEEVDEEAFEKAKALHTRATEDTDFAKSLSYTSAYSLDTAFDWSNSEEGHTYWAGINRKKTTNMTDKDMELLMEENIPAEPTYPDWVMQVGKVDAEAFRKAKALYDRAMTDEGFSKRITFDVQGCSLLGAFYWEGSDEGSKYWSLIDDKIEKGCK